MITTDDIIDEIWEKHSSKFQSKLHLRIIIRFYVLFLDREMKGYRPVFLSKMGSFELTPEGKKKVEEKKIRDLEKVNERVKQFYRRTGRFAWALKYIEDSF